MTEKNIEGEGKMVTQFGNANLREFVGIKIEWKMFLYERQGLLKGSAETVRINDMDLDYNIRTNLEFEGTIKENKILLNYIENGKNRKTSGQIEAILDGNEFKVDFHRLLLTLKELCIV